MRRTGLLLVLLLALAPVVFGQPDTQTDSACPAIVQQAMAAVDDICADAGRNEACYGHVSLTAQPQPNITNFAFSSVGDLVPVAALQSLRLGPMDTQAQTWGVALMRLQANLPDTLPGQNVNFLLFGDVEITNRVMPDSGAPPMQAFILKTRLGDAVCDEAPESGLLVQTPEGATEVTFNINGIDVTMGSTVYFQAEPGAEMIVSVPEGAAVLEIAGETFPVLAGTWINFPVDAALRLLDRPTLPRPYETRGLENLSLALGALDRAVTLRPSLTEAEIDELRRRILAGEPICGVEPYPDCPAGGRLRDLLTRPNVLDCLPRSGAAAPDDTRPACPELPDLLPDLNLPALPDLPLRPTVEALPLPIRPPRLP